MSLLRQRRVNDGMADEYYEKLPQEFLIFLFSASHGVPGQKCVDSSNARFSDTPFLLASSVSTHNCFTHVLQPQLVVTRFVLSYMENAL